MSFKVPQFNGQGSVSAHLMEVFGNYKLRLRSYCEPFWPQTVLILAANKAEQLSLS